MKCDGLMTEFTEQTMHSPVPRTRGLPRHRRNWVMDLRPKMARHPVVDRGYGEDVQVGA